MRNSLNGIPPIKGSSLIFGSACVIVMCGICAFAFGEGGLSLIIFLLAGLCALSDIWETDALSSLYQIVDLDGDYEEFDALEDG